MAFRVDIGSALRSVKYLKDGGARIDATLTRTGVFTYRTSDGSTVREYRPDSEVFNEDSMASFEALPVTDDHPPVMVTAENLAEYKRGRSGDTIRRDGQHMVGALIIDDAALIAKMKAGKREVSNGYECDLDPTPGISPDGEKYDMIQRNIRGNHIAIVDAGRAGTARVRMDAAVMIDSSSADNASVALANETANAAVKGKIMDELTSKLTAALNASAAEKARADAAEVALKAEKVRADKADALGDDQKARADKAEAELAQLRKDAIDVVPALIKARVALITKANSVLGGVKLDGKDILDSDDRAIMVAVVEKIDGLKIAADKSADYVSARFDAAYERADKSVTALSNVRAAVDQGIKSDGAPIVQDNEDREVAARKKMIRDAANAYKTNGSN